MTAKKSQFQLKRKPIMTPGDRDAILRRLAVQLTMCEMSAREAAQFLSIGTTMARRLAVILMDRGIASSRRVDTETARAGITVMYFAVAGCEINEFLGSECQKVTISPSGDEDYSSKPRLMALRNADEMAKIKRNWFGGVAA